MLLVLHLNEEPRSLCSLQADIPAPLEEWVLKLLCKKPEQRFQSAREARLAMDRT